VRTIADRILEPALRVSLNLNAIAAAPQALESYAPNLFIDMSVLPRLFGRAAAY
jgi:hypothetical protein